MRRLVGPLLGVLLAAAGVVALLVFFSGRDDAGVPAAHRTGPGQLQPDLGDRHIPAGAPRPARSTDVPTSGPHTPLPVPGDRVPLDPDQILHALELGNVVILYPGRRGAPPPAPLVALQRQVAGSASTRQLIASGQAVVLSPRGKPGVVALAWRRLERASGPGDPRLVRFADYWLGTLPGA